MNRRKGVPCGCGADPCGCSPKNHCVKAINNVSPDPNGDFAIEAGQNVTITETEYGIEISSAGSAEDVVKTVNGVSPDADGEVTITAGSNITITPDAATNSIEIEASVPTVDAVAPIYIDEDGKINLAEWELVTSTDWSQYMDENECATEDLLLSLYKYNQYGDDAIIPKGAKLAYYGVNSASGWQSYTGIIALAMFSFVDYFRYPAVSHSYYLNKIGLNVSGSGINQKMNYNIDRSNTSIAKQTTLTGEGLRLFVRRH